MDAVIIILHKPDIICMLVGSQFSYYVYILYIYVSHKLIDGRNNQQKFKNKLYFHKTNRFRLYNINYSFLMN
jgi:hypothetical protein